MTMFKRNVTRRTVLQSIPSAAAVLAAVPAVADEWPSRPIRLVIGQTAGGAPDVICRLVAARLSDRIGQQVIVDNRGGAAGMIGTQLAASAPADGYTLLFGMAAPLATHPYTIKSLPYDPAKDFAPIAMVAESYFFILVHPDVKANTLSELIALDKANPGKIAIATNGAKTFTGILMDWLNHRTGTKFQLVPYNAITQGVQDALTGRVQGILLAGAAAAPFISSGQMRALAVSSASRLRKFEQVQTIAETLPGVNIAGWFVLVAPTGTPAPIVQRINAEMNVILKEPDMLNRLEAMGFYTPGAGTPETTGQYIQTQLHDWGKMISTIGVRPE